VEGELGEVDRSKDVDLKADVLMERDSVPEIQSDVCGALRADDVAEVVEVRSEVDDEGGVAVADAEPGVESMWLCRSDEVAQLGTDHVAELDDLDASVDAELQLLEEVEHELDVRVERRWRDT